MSSLHTNQDGLLLVNLTRLHACADSKCSLALLDWCIWMIRIYRFIKSLFSPKYRSSASLFIVLQSTVLVTFTQ